MTSAHDPIFSRAANPLCAALGPSAAAKGDHLREHFPHLAGDCMNAWRVAYSIGSYFAHTSWAPRNDGMPLSTEIPAPVKATARFDARPRRRAASDRAAPARARELRLPDERPELERQPHVSTTLASRSGTPSARSVSRKTRSRKSASAIVMVQVRGGASPSATATLRVRQFHVPGGVGDAELVDAVHPGDFPVSGVQLVRITPRRIPSPWSRHLRNPLDFRMK